MDLRTLRLAIATWEKGASRVNDCKAIGGSVGEKVDQGWAGENGDRSASVLQPSQIAGRALSTLCGKTKQASLEGSFESDLRAGVSPSPFATSTTRHALMLKVDALQPHSILIAGAISLGYAALLLAEGIGLWLELSWAAYLTVVSTSALVPFEVYEIIERVTLPRIILLAVNLVIVLYLVKQLKQHTLRRS